ncbi:hypothetical protein MRX96_055310 [Rhipicephalus microplus]
MRRNRSYRARLGALTVSVPQWATLIVAAANNGDACTVNIELTINSASCFKEHPLAKVQEILAALSGGQVFTTLKLRMQAAAASHKSQEYCCNDHTPVPVLLQSTIAFGVASAYALFLQRIESTLQGEVG